ncbi:hypothetical protein AMECASPLE_004792 [Ameca splendens]|uniref:Uncharacterized protein n=1 Tax=Ameca splendens TaxID=208324 RepID=A0ABV0XYS2_9TELE
MGQLVVSRQKEIKLSSNIGSCWHGDSSCQGGTASRHISEVTGPARQPTVKISVYTHPGPGRGSSAWQQGHTHPDYRPPPTLAWDNISEREINWATAAVSFKAYRFRKLQQNGTPSGNEWTRWRKIQTRRPTTRADALIPSRRIFVPVLINPDPVLCWVRISTQSYVASPRTIGAVNRSTVGPASAPDWLLLWFPPAGDKQGPGNDAAQP